MILCSNINGAFNGNSTCCVSHVEREKHCNEITQRLSHSSVIRHRPYVSRIENNKWSSAILCLTCTKPVGAFIFDRSTVQWQNDYLFRRREYRRIFARSKLVNFNFFSYLYHISYHILCEFQSKNKFAWFVGDSLVCNKHSKILFLTFAFSRNSSTRLTSNCQLDVLN